MTLVDRPLESRVCDIVQVAQNQHFRVEPCDRCGGPRIFSKVRPASKCFACGNFRVEDAVIPQKTKQKCRRCKTFEWRVTKSNYCDRCRPKVIAKKGDSMLNTEKAPEAPKPIKNIE